MFPLYSAILLPPLSCLFAFIFLLRENKELHPGFLEPMPSNFPITRNASAYSKTPVVILRIFFLVAPLVSDSPEKLNFFYLLVAYCLRCNPMLSED